MNNSVLVLRVILQSSFAFVGLSILLGRLYALTYFRELGIPTSEVAYNVMDYSIIAPFVTLSGLLVVSVPTIIFLGFPPFQSETRNSSRTTWGLITGFIGALILILTIFVLEGDGIFENITLPTFLSPLPIFLSFVTLIFSALGGALALSGQPRFSISSSKIGEGWTGALSLGMPILKTGTIMTLALMYVFMATILLVIGNAEIGAQRTLSEAPRAMVVLADSEQSNSWNEGECSSAEECGYAVILIGDHFVYLASNSKESTDMSDSSKMSTVYAVPIKDIAYFKYLKE